MVEIVTSDSRAKNARPITRSRILQGLLWTVKKANV